MLLWGLRKQLYSGPGQALRALSATLGEDAVDSISHEFGGPKPKLTSISSILQYRCHLLLGTDVRTINELCCKFLNVQRLNHRDCQALDLAHQQLAKRLARFRTDITSDIRALFGEELRDPLEPFHTRVGPGAKVFLDCAAQITRLLGDEMI